jgi:hypothetical protein
MARAKATPTVVENGVPANRIVDVATKEVVKIKPLRQQLLVIPITGTGTYMQNKFSKKAVDKMEEIQRTGSQSRGKKVREPRNFKADFEAATYRFPDGSYGIPASAFRKAMISACRTVGFAMTLAKLSVFVVEDGRDMVDNTPLVRLKGKPVMDVRPARNDNGSCDLRSRPRFDEWSAVVCIRFDLGLYSASDIINLLVRVGAQVGIGEGRPDSPNSAGIDMGLFKVHVGEGVFTDMNTDEVAG